jgi:hypothetical protein
VLSGSDETIARRKLDEWVAWAQRSRIQPFR